MHMETVIEQQNINLETLIWRTAAKNKVEKVVLNLNVTAKCNNWSPALSVKTKSKSLVRKQLVMTLCIVRVIAKHGFTDAVRAYQ